MDDQKISTAGAERKPANDTASSECDTSTSHFLRLPGELRNQIYAYVLTDKYHLKVLRRARKTKSIFQHSRKHRIALLFVCREIHAETALLPFQLNKWRFTSYVGIEVLCAKLTVQQRSAIRAVCMYLDLNIHPNRRDMRSALVQKGVRNLLYLLPGLRSVQAMVIWQPNVFRLEGPDALRVYVEELKDWMSGGREMSVDMHYHYGWLSPILLSLRLRE